MTSAQRRWLAEIGSVQEMPAEKIPGATRSALYGLGLIEDCARMFYGPRTHRVKLTIHGHDELSKQNRRRAAKEGAT